MTYYLLYIETIVNSIFVRVVGAAPYTFMNWFRTVQRIASTQFRPSQCVRPLVIRSTPVSGGRRLPNRTKFGVGASKAGNGCRWQVKKLPPEATSKYRLKPQGFQHSPLLIGDNRARPEICGNIKYLLRVGDRLKRADRICLGKFRSNPGLYSNSCHRKVGNSWNEWKPYKFVNIVSTQRNEEYTTRKQFKRKMRNAK